MSNGNNGFESAQELKKAYATLVELARKNAIRCDAFAASKRTTTQQAALELAQLVSEDLRMALMQEPVYAALERTQELIVSLGARSAAELQQALDALTLEARWETLMHAAPRVDAQMHKKIQAKAKAQARNDA